MEGAPNDNLYVTGLPPEIDDTSLRMVFGPYGVVTQCRVLPPVPGKADRVAFVRYQTVEEAASVRAGLNGQVPPGLTETVNVKFANTSGAGAGKGDSGYGKIDNSINGTVNRSSPYGNGYEDTPSDNLYVMGLPPTIDDQNLRQIFASYGIVTQCKVLPPRPGQSHSVALIRYQSVMEATMVKDLLNGNIPTGLEAPVVVRYKAPSLNKGGEKGTDWQESGFKPMFEREEPPSDNLYIMGLPSEMDDPTLKQIFMAYGAVAQCKVLPPRPGQTHAVALVRYRSVEEATIVKNMLNGNIPQGLPAPIFIKYKAVGDGKGFSKGAAISQADTGVGTTTDLALAGLGPGGLGASSLGSAGLATASLAGTGLGIAGMDLGDIIAVGEPPASDTLNVTGLPADIDSLRLRHSFEAYGVLIHCEPLPLPAGSGGGGAASVRYRTAEEAAWVRNHLDGNIPQGLEAPVCVRYAASTQEAAALLQPQPLQAQLGPGPAMGPSNAVGNGSGAGGSGAVAAPGCISANVGDSNDGTAGMMSGKVIANGFVMSGLLPGGPAGQSFSSEAGAIVVSGLPADMEDVDLYRIFAPFGAIAPKGVCVATNVDGSCKGFGIVNFMEVAAAQSAIVICNGTPLPDGTQMKVTLKSESFV